MAPKARLDTELVRRGLARSRQHAQTLVSEGRVRVGGLPATKPATGIAPDTPVRVVAVGHDEFVSRGGRKLRGALDRLGGPDVTDRRCLDAGASTGGFTDVLLRRGAREVVAVDVGYGELAWSLRTDDRVRVHERTNVRTLTPNAIGGLVDVVVADLSFISLTLVLPALTRCARGPGDVLLLVKPQFEAGRDQVGAGGVVRDPAVRADCVRRVAATGSGLGWGTRGLVASPLPGPAGNVEYFVWLRKDAPAMRDGDLARAIEEGPQ